MAVCVTDGEDDEDDEGCDDGWATVRREKSRDSDERDTKTPSLINIGFSCRTVLLSFLG